MESVEHAWISWSTVRCLRVGGVTGITWIAVENVDFHGRPVKARSVAGCPGAPRSPRSGGDHAKHANHRGVPQRTGSVWTACSATEHAERRGAPRSAAERRGAPRSAAERRGAPRSAAEHAKYVAARMPREFELPCSCCQRCRQLPNNLTQTQLNCGPVYASAARSAGIGRVTIEFEFELSSVVWQLPAARAAALGTFGVALGAFALRFAMPALQVGAWGAVE
eukprot:gene12631-biopygen3037